MVFACKWGFCLQYNNIIACRPKRTPSAKTALSEIKMSLCFGCMSHQIKICSLWRSCTCMPWCYRTSPGSPCATAGAPFGSLWTLWMPQCPSVLRRLWRNCASRTETPPTRTSRRTGSQGPYGSSDASPDSMFAPTTPSLTTWNQVGHLQVSFSIWEKKYKTSFLQEMLDLWVIKTTTLTTWLFHLCYSNDTSAS